MKRFAHILTFKERLLPPPPPTARWRDSQLIGGWLADLAANLHHRSDAALDDITPGYAQEPHF